jgi:hypothetical protein
VCNEQSRGEEGSARYSVCVDAALLSLDLFDLVLRGLDSAVSARGASGAVGDRNGWVGDMDMNDAVEWHSWFEYGVWMWVARIFSVAEI